MKSQGIKKKIAKLPDSPGVYFFLSGKKILYIGKATSLRDRVRSYFAGDISETRGPLITKMLAEFDNISFQKTDSVLEALILEAALIKKHQPPANTMEKDDKSWNYVIITDEPFPRVLVIRGKELQEQEKVPFSVQNLRRAPSLFVAHSFGPFTNGSQLKEAMKIVRRLFPYRDKCEPCDLHIHGLHRATLCKPCFNRQIGLCPGVCTGEISEKEYAKTIKNIVLFFEGNKKQVVKNLQKEMKKLAGQKKFEEAGKIKKQIFALGHIQDVALIKNSRGSTFNAQFSKVGPWNAGSETFRIESYDIAHMSGQNMVGVMTVVENSEAKKSCYRKFKIRGQSGANDTKALAEILTRRLSHIEWPRADLIVVDGGVAQKNAVEKVLKENREQIPVVSVVKDERHRPKQILGDKKWLARESEILLANSEAHRFAILFHKKLRGKIV